MRNGLLLICGLWLIQAAADLDYSSTVSKLLSCWNVKSSTCQSQVSAALPVLAGILQDPTTTVSSLVLLAAPVASVITSHQHAGLHCTVLTSLDHLLQPEEAPLDAACAASTGSASCLASVTASFNQSLSSISGVPPASRHFIVHHYCHKGTATSSAGARCTCLHTNLGPQQGGRQATAPDRGADRPSLRHAACPCRPWNMSAAAQQPAGSSSQPDPAVRLPFRPLGQQLPPPRWSQRWRTPKIPTCSPASGESALKVFT